MTIMLALLLSIPNNAVAQTAPEAGYVVKVDSTTVYLDLAAQSGAQAGQPFTVYTEGEELKHPVTGASLGRLENKVGEGTIREVLAMYSIGALSAYTDVKPGMRARLGSKPAPPPQQVYRTQATAESQAPQTGRAPHWKSPSVDFQATSMAIGDFKGDKTLQVALSETDKVSLFPYPFSEAKPIAVFKHPTTNVHIVNLEASDLKADGKQELFVALYNETFTRFETVILSFDGAEFKKEAEVPGLVRALQDESGKRYLAVQQLTDDLTFPFNGIYPLVYKDGKYSAGSPAIHFKRIDFLFDFNTANFDGKSVIYLTNLDHVRVQFGNGHYWKTTDAYGQTPIRHRWPAVSAGRMLEFHPPMPVIYGSDKKASVYLAHNISMLGSLSEPFGLFTKGEIYRKTWTGLGLEDDWKSEIAGFCPTLLVVDVPGRGQELAAAVVGTAGKSAIWSYDP